jgi:hypothetical protein
VNAVGDATLGNQLIFGQVSYRVFVDARVEHRVSVDRELEGDVLEERVEVAGVSAAVVGHLLQVPQLAREPADRRTSEYWTHTTTLGRIIVEIL